MTRVTSLSDDHWCKTEGVREKLDIPNKDAERTYRSAIDSATNSVQSWYRQETGDSTLPDPSNVPALVEEATEWLAVSEASFTYSRNFSGGEEGPSRSQSAESRAERKFKEWAEEDDVSSSEATTEGEMSDVDAQHGSLIDEW